MRGQRHRTKRSRRGGHQSTFFALATIWLAGVSADAQSLFQVGNSLTEDSAPNGIVSMAAAAGIDVTSGLHLRSDSSLDTIWNDPTSYTRIRSEWGTFDQALPNNQWDHVTLQVFGDNSDLTLADDFEVFERYRSLTQQFPGNSDTQFYVHAPWPWTNRWSRWDRTVPNEDETFSTHRRSYYEHLVDRLNAEEPTRFRLIPAGEVFYELRERIASDEEGVFSDVGSIYRDPIHANGIGRFATATTVFATVFQSNPIGLPIDYSADPLWNPTILPPDLVLAIQEVVWDVVVRTRRTGVSPLGDFDISTVIDERDYDLWSEAFAAQTILSADANGDGVVSEVDGELWVEGAQPGITDFDQDGAIGDGDRVIWNAEYATATGPLSADANGDGVVNAIDYTTWRDELELREATDFNSDGVVDAADAAVWQAELGWRVDQPTDANGDGVVNAIDYTIWRDNRAIYNPPLSVAVPEPSGLTAAAIVLSLLFRRRVA
ncbi:MAG: dockerin type I domain-containing protein [Planctomycetota bacterium]